MAFAARDEGRAVDYAWWRRSDRLALLRHCEKFFDATALAILASTGLLYCVTHLKYLSNGLCSPIDILRFDPELLP
jgi:hypothetical protein